MSDLRIGHGYDLHRLEPIAPKGAGRPFVLGGLRFDHERGPVAHSDGDALLHAITDAVLAALGEPDLGTLFRDDDPRWKDGDSRQFVVEAALRLRTRGYALRSLDATVICERPKIGPRRDELVRSIAGMLGVAPEIVNVKGKTHEKVDAVGEGRAIEVHAVALIEK